MPRRFHGKCSGLMDTGFPRISSVHPQACQVKKNRRDRPYKLGKQGDGLAREMEHDRIVRPRVVHPQGLAPDELDDESLKRTPGDYNEQLRRGKAPEASSTPATRGWKALSSSREIR